MNEREYDPMLDCYLSWEAFIAHLRQRWLAGEPITGPWAKHLEEESYGRPDPR